MRLLLDTHCLLWARAAPARLSSEARAALTDPRHQLFVSVASAWEIVIKHALGRLELAHAPESLVPRLIAATQAVTLPIDAGEAETLLDRLEKQRSTGKGNQQRAKADAAPRKLL